MSKCTLSDFIATIVSDLATTLKAIDSSSVRYNRRYQESNISLEFYNPSEEIRNLRVSSLLIDIPVQWNLRNKQSTSTEYFAASKRRLIVSNFPESMNISVNKNDRLYLEINTDKISSFEHK
jgi:hypothetical protein